MAGGARSEEHGGARSVQRGIVQPEEHAACVVLMTVLLTSWACCRNDRLTSGSFLPPRVGEAGGPPGEGGAAPPSPAGLAPADSASNFARAASHAPCTAIRTWAGGWSGMG